MWTLIHWALTLGLPTLQIFGDSSVIIDWELGKASLSCLSLDYWCEAIRHMMPLFLRLDMQHIYREHNQCPDGLLKEALFLAPGLYYISKFFDDSVIEFGKFQLF